MKLFHFFLLAALLGVFAHDGSAQGTPDCSQTLTFTGAGVGVAVNTTTGAQAGCAGWRLTWSVAGSITAAKVHLEGSQDNSTFADFSGLTIVLEGVNPTSWTSATVSNTIVVRASLPYIRVEISDVSGTGTVKTTLLGYHGTSAQLDSGGSGITQLTGDVTAGPGSGSVAATGVRSANLTGGVLGSTPYQSAPDTTLFVPPNITTTPKFWSMTGDGSNGAAPSWQTVPTGGQFIYYFTDTASSIATYLQQTVSPYTPKTTLAFSGVTTGTATLQNWATNAGIPGLTFIPAGVFTFHVHALRSAGTKAIQLQCVFEEVSSVGVDIGAIGTSELSAALTATETEYSLALVTSSPYIMGSSASRVVARVQAVGAAAGTNATVHIFVGDEADSHIAFPSVTVDVTSFVPYTGATANVDLGVKTITAAGGTFGSLVSGSTQCVEATTAGVLTGTGTACGSGGGGGGTLLSGAVDPAVPMIHLVQANGVTSGSATIAFASNVTAGNLLIAFTTGNAPQSPLFDTLGSIWTVGDSMPGGGSPRGVYYWAIAAGSGADTITMGTGAGLWLEIAEFSGIAAVPFDVKAFASSGNSISVTTSANYDLLVSFYQDGGVVTMTSSNLAIAVQKSNTWTGAIGWRQTGLAGSNSVSWTFPASDIIGVAAFKAGPAGIGNNGDWYLNTTTGVLWGPKTGGVWAMSSASFVSQTGSNGQFVLTGSPSVSSCGGGTPGLATGASNTAGTINVGSGVTTACTLSFSQSFTNAPACIASSDVAASIGSISAISASSVTFAFSLSVGAGHIFYVCF